MTDRWFKSVGLVLSFGTIFPMPNLGSVDDVSLRRSIAWFPLVGLLLGLALWGVITALACIVPRAVAAIMALALYTVATGGLHLDGLMDTMDALGSRKPAALALAIMKDSRVGAMGAIAGILLLMGKALAFSHLPLTASPGAWVAVPMIARAAVIWPMAKAPAAQESGLGAIYAQKIPLRSIITATAMGLLGVWLLVPFVAALVLSLVTVLMAWGWTRFIARRFGGFTGDTYGALIEIVEWLGFLVLTGGFGHG